MKLVEIDTFEENGGEFALVEDGFLVILTGPNAGDFEDGVLPSFSETNKSLREVLMLHEFMKHLEKTV